MPDHVESPLRNSLDVIDAMRRRTQLLGWIVVAVALTAYAHLAWVQRTHNVERILNASVLALTTLVAWVSFAVILIMMKMTRRILRALDLALRDAPPPEGAELARKPPRPI
jgi:hypothetical protein